MQLNCTKIHPIFRVQYHESTHTCIQTATTIIKILSVSITPKRIPVPPPEHPLTCHGSSRIFEIFIIKLVSAFLCLAFLSAC